jgi:hypothetical protein
MQNCTESAQPLQLNFDISGVKKIEGEFSAPELSSDGGLLLIRAADDRLNLSEQIALKLDDKRQSGKVKYSLVDMVRQRMYMIATGNEDVNDADRLASDPMHKICVGSNPETESDLASDSTIGRLESNRTAEELERLQQLLVHLYLQRLPKIPDKIVLDIWFFRRSTRSAEAFVLQRFLPNELLHSTFDRCRHFSVSSDTPLREGWTSRRNS